MPKYCIPCDSTSDVLTSNAIEEALPGLDGYVLVNDHGIDQIRKTYSFNNYLEALSFVSRVAQLSEQENHHPKIILEWKKATIYWWTHSIAGLHANDLIMARQCENIYQNQ